MNFWTQFFGIYGMPILYALLTALAGIAATGVAKAYNKIANSREKRAVAKTVVLAVEQIYKDLHGEEKYLKALQSLVEILGEKGIPITELEARMLIESAVGEFNEVFKDNVEPLPDENQPVELKDLE